MSVILCDTTYLGRHPLGDKLPLALTTVNAAGVPTSPDAAPYADLYVANTLIETIRLPRIDRQQTAQFGYGLLLGGKYSTGQGFVVYRYLLSAVPYQAFSYFQIIPGGTAKGAIIALREYRKPEAQFLVGHQEDGGLIYKRNPQ